MEREAAEGIGGFAPGKIHGSPLWRAEGILRAGLLLAVGHALNESKSQAACPLALAEAWVSWDPAESAPRQARLELFWGTRYGAGPSGRDEGWGEGGFARAKADSDRAWREIVGSALAEPEVDCAPSPKWAGDSGAARGRRDRERRILVYRDTRCPEGVGGRLASKLWLERREALKKAPGEAASLFSELGKALACAALPRAGDDLGLGRLRGARAEGARIGKEAIGSGEFWESDAEKVAFDYDMACREIGEIASEAGTMEEASGILDGFFLELGRNPIWPLLAGGGEQEAYFPLLCRLEPEIFRLIGRSGLDAGEIFGEKALPDRERKE